MENWNSGDGQCGLHSETLRRRYVNWRWIERIEGEVILGFMLGTKYVFSDLGRKSDYDSMFKPRFKLDRLTKPNETLLFGPRPIYMTA